MTDRAAIDTIKGYFYQFDYAIHALLSLPTDTDIITVEGIEDVDLKTATEETAIQCKYYAKTEYNHSVIGKPIRLMLNHFKEVKNGTKKKINYKLYGFFEAGQNKLSLPIDRDFLKTHFLTYTSKGTKYYHHTELSLNDKDLNEFLSYLTVDISALEYQAQLGKIFTLLIKCFKCSQFEAEHFYYNNCLKVIKDIAIENKISKRKITKSSFLTKINFKSILFNEWFIQYKGEAKLWTELKAQYFTNLNTSSFERFFIVEVPATDYVRSDLKELIFIISRKWSKLSSREPHPFCPYIYIHNISNTELLELKKEMQAEGFKFVDGFDFAGAAFSPKSIIQTANHSNGIKIKILNELNYIGQTIAEINKTKEIYQFFLTTSFFDHNNHSIKHVKIQVPKLTDIKKII